LATGIRRAEAEVAVEVIEGGQYRVDGGQLFLADDAQV
jgi:hypothetical protein